MSKKLNESAMQTELSTSAFFSKPASLEPETEVVIKVPSPAPRHHEPNGPIEEPPEPDPMTPRHRDTTTPASADSNEDLVERIRRAVKPPGKEDATYRFSSEEKKSLADIVYNYGAAGIRTSQNEIARIGINNLLEDYRQNGQRSLLAKVLERLNS